MIQWQRFLRLFILILCGSMIVVGGMSVCSCPVAAGFTPTPTPLPPTPTPLPPTETPSPPPPTATPEPDVPPPPAPEPTATPSATPTAMPLLPDSGGEAASFLGLILLAAGLVGIALSCLLLRRQRMS